MFERFAFNDVKSIQLVVPLLIVCFLTATVNASESPGPINVRTFGCTGDDVHDDSECFEAVNAYVQKISRLNQTLNSDGNHFGGASIEVPAGTYLVTDPQSIMGRGKAARTFGYRLAGSGDGITVIDYRPKTPGPLLLNNDQWLNLSFSGITFLCADSNSDFIDSKSDGGAQGYHFSDVTWGGKWKEIVNLSGTNTNSEWDFNHVTVSGSVRDVVYIPEAGTSDQFLNYWFDHSKIDLTHGNFISAAKGGHFKISDCDFSGLQGSGNPNKPDVLFLLKGRAHASGVTYLECRGSRFELQTPSIRVLDSEWGNFGEVVFEGNDFSSQSGRFEPVEEFVIRLNHSAGGAQYNFVRSHIIGMVRVDYSNSDAGYRQSVSFDDVQFLSFEDFSKAIVLNDADSNIGHGSNVAKVDCKRCRGSDGNPKTQYGCVLGGRVAKGQRVFCNNYVYEAITGGQSKGKVPAGRSKLIQDGEVEWATVDTFSGSEYAENATLRVLQQPPNGDNSEVKTAVISIDGNGTPFGRIILPPFAIVLQLQLVIPKRSGTWTIRNDAYQSAVLLSSETKAKQTADQNWAPLLSNRLYETSGDIGQRSIILENVPSGETRGGGYAILWYI
jgi:hypothetical protein